METIDSIYEYLNGSLTDFENFSQDKLDNIFFESDLPHSEKDTYELDIRNRSYSDILSSYNDYIQLTLHYNLKSKNVFVKSLLSVFGFIAFGFVMTIILIIIYKPEHMTLVSILITAIVSLISSLIIIPTHIIKYLFNIDETKQIGEIIKNIQEYDKVVRDDLLNQNHQ